ncbi:MAG: dihydrofolate reductase [Puniceicoccales bacterium]|jgi:dihydrofolate reductase|nr:dihydrofolate reductase [Puniceicoccales bacterium]
MLDGTGHNMVKFCLQKNLATPEQVLPTCIHARMSIAGKLSIIVAVSKNGVIGKNGRIPWRISEELKFFRSITMGHTVIMGRKTFESIGKPLPGRKNLIITRNENWLPKDFCGKLSQVNILSNIDAALDMIQGSPASDHFWAIGGEEIYQQFLPYVGTIVCSEISAAYEGDAFFQIPRTFARGEKLHESPQFVAHRWVRTSDLDETRHPLYRN